MGVHDHTARGELTAAHLWAYKYTRDRDLHFTWHEVKVIDKAFFANTVLRRFK